MNKTLKTTRKETSLESLEVFHRVIEMVRTCETNSHLFASRRYFENYCQSYETVPYQPPVFEFEYEKKRIEILKNGFKYKN